MNLAVLSEKVLVVNRSWKAIDEVTVQTAICDCVRGAATAIDTTSMLATHWQDWEKLPIREGDRFVRSVRGPVRIPTVICKAKYDKIPKPRRAKRNPSSRDIAERDGYVCQVTGEHAPDGTCDHVVPKARGGGEGWDNKVWMKKELNHKKGNRLNDEVGIKLIRQPTVPTVKVRRFPIRHPDWEMFVSN